MLVKSDIKTIIKNNEAHLVFYIDGLFIYRVCVDGVFRLFSFSSSEIKDSEIRPKEKAITFMRFIDNAIKSSDFNRQVFEPEPINSYARLVYYKNGNFFYRTIETNRLFVCNESKLMYTQDSMTSERFSMLFEEGSINFIEEDF